MKTSESLIYRLWLFERWLIQTLSMRFTFPTTDIATMIPPSPRILFPHISNPLPSNPSTLLNPGLATWSFSSFFPPLSQRYRKRLRKHISYIERRKTSLQKIITQTSYRYLFVQEKAKVFEQLLIMLLTSRRIGHVSQRLFYTHLCIVHFFQI